MTFVGAGLGLLGYIQTGKIDRRIALSAAYEQPITNVTATVRVVVSSSDDVNISSPISGGYFLIGKGSTPLLTTADVSCRVRQIGNDQVEYTGTFDAQPNDACMGEAVRSLAHAFAGNVKFNLMGIQDVVGGEVVLLLNGHIRFDIPIPPQQMEMDIVVIPNIGEILRSQMPGI